MKMNRKVVRSVICVLLALIFIVSLMTALIPINASAASQSEINQLTQQRKELQAKQKEQQKAEKKMINSLEGVAGIGIDDFAKVELRVAEVKACEKVPKAKKLLKLTLDDGTGKDRTVASGIAKWYAPEDLVGKKVVVVANLKPAVLCGVESNGMILAADCSEDDVKVVFVDKSMPNGSKIR